MRSSGMLQLEQTVLTVACIVANPRHEWPQWQAQDLCRIFQSVGTEGVDLMKKMLQYDPVRRISVSAASFCA